MSPFLLLLFGLVAPVSYAVKYLVQTILKAVVESIGPKSNAGLHDAILRLTVIVTGAVGELIIALCGARYVHVTFPHTLEGYGLTAIFGAAAGLVAIGDYHLLDALKSLASGQGIPSISPLDPTPAASTPSTLLPISGYADTLQAPPASESAPPAPPSP